MRNRISRIMEKVTSLYNDEIQIESSLRKQCLWRDCFKYILNSTISWKIKKIASSMKRHAILSNSYYLP